MVEARYVMEEEEDAPRIPLLAQLQAEDLSRMPKDELEDRLARLQAEIKRVEEALQARQSTRSEAESLFKK